MMPNFEAMTDFWNFINERHRIYLKKEAGEPKPWTEDKILQDWKFCNVFRKLDRQSIELENIILMHELAKPELLLFNIFQFRAFNWAPTYWAIGWSQIWDETYNTMLLKKYLDKGNRFSSAAYMLRGREGMPKYISIVKSLTHIWEEKENLLRGFPRYTHHGKQIDTLQAVQETILYKGFWGWGPFTAYQIALDLTSTSILPKPADINDWTYFGPGATKGLREIWPNLKSQDFLKAAQFLLADQIKYREEHVPELNLQDIEFCLCELQKYRRIKSGGKAKEHYAGTEIA